MSKRSIHSTEAAVLAVIILACAGFGMNSLMNRPRTRVVRAYSPSADVPRLSFAGDSVPGAVFVRDFDADEDDLYLLDSGASRVIEMREHAGHWSVENGFGRRGAGPGEFMQPSGIAVDSNRVLVMDRDRIHVFDRAGAYVLTRAPSLPCPLMDPHLSIARHGLLISGRCMRADTSTAELFFVGDDDHAVSIAHDPLYTSDGQSGSMFAAESFYSGGRDRGLFGGGTGECVFAILPHDSSAANYAPRAKRVCGIAASRYPFVASPEFRRKAQALAAARPFAAAALAIPELLPSYIERVAAGNADLLLRPFTNDSLAFRRIHSDRDELVAPVEGLIGCRAAGCAWIEQDGTPRVMFVPMSIIEGAVVRRP